MLRVFIITENGNTHPRLGEINGRRYIAKCGDWSGGSSDGHVANELAADEFLRRAGFRVPASKEYRVDFGNGERVVRLAEYKENTLGLDEAWRRATDVVRARIREQVLAAYPIQSLIAGIDTFSHDNVRVDANGELWFVDNGASFDYRARGGRKGWFWTRNRVNDPHYGYLSLARHRDQSFLRRLLGGVDAAALWQAAARAPLKDYAAALPDSLRRKEFVDYIEALGKAAAAAVANPKPPRTELVIVLDRSGSMYGVEGDVIGGFNNLIAKQCAEKGECRVSTVLFDSEITVLHDRVSIGDVGRMTPKQYCLGGATALFDAVGSAILHHINVQRKLPYAEKADKVIIAVITDGGENSSVKFNAQTVSSLVRHQTDEWGWEFLFLGANIDAAAAAGEIGIDARRAVNFICDSTGLETSYSAVNAAVRNVRAGRRVEDCDNDGNRWRDGIDRDYSLRH